MASEFLYEKESKILELDTRRKIYDIVKTFAGCHFREIERKCMLPTGTVKYHLSYLSRHGLVKEQRDNGNVRYFPREFKHENKKMLALLRQQKVREIILFILIHPDCNHEQIVSAVHVSPSTVSWHLKKLGENKVVSSMKKGRKTFFKLLIDKNELISLLIAYKESFLDSLVDRIVEMWE